MRTVASIIHLKQDKTIHSIASGAMMREALESMARHNVGALLVIDEGNIVGIVSERDYARKGVLLGHLSGDTPVSAFMTTAVMYVSPEETSDHCMALMTSNRLRHLPVLDEGRLVGLVSIGDLVKDIISHQQFVIEQLQHYIQGGSSPG